VGSEPVNAQIANQHSATQSTKGNTTNDVTVLVFGAPGEIDQNSLWAVLTPSGRLWRLKRWRVLSNS